jgi:hypothetical protein
MTHRFLSFAAALFLALLLPACKKKSPPTEEPPAQTPPAPQPKVEKSLKEKLLGAWERTPAADGYPVFVEFRSDGTATLKHQQPDGMLQVANGTVEYPEATGLGPYLLQVKVPNGGYGLLVDVVGNELHYTRGGTQEPLKFRKVK